MVRVRKSDRKELLASLQKAVTTQVQLFDHLTAIEELIGHVTGLDDWVRQEAADYDGPEHVNITHEQLKHMLHKVRREK